MDYGHTRKWRKVSSDRSLLGGSMKVGDLVVEHINDRIGTIIKIEKNNGKNKYTFGNLATVLLEDGSTQRFPTAYLGRYK